MNRRLSIFITMLAVLLSMQMPARKDAKPRAKNQEYINQGRTLTERFNRMGEVFVGALKAEVQDIIDKNKWGELGLEERKIYLFISFKKVEKAGEVTLDKILNPGDKSLHMLKIVVYEMLANAIKSAINHDRRLKDYIVTLSVDPGTLKAAIAETGDPMYNQAKKLEFSRMDSMNANYHFFYEAFPQANKIVLGGRADIIERNHEIATTYNYEIAARELFDKYPGQKNPVPVRTRPPSVKSTGSENIYFYYSNQRDKTLESYLKKYAAEVGKDIKFRGFETNIEKYTQRAVNASIKRPLLHYRETVLSLKHE